MRITRHTAGYIGIGLSGLGMLLYRGLKYLPASSHLPEPLLMALMGLSLLICVAGAFVMLGAWLLSRMPDRSRAAGSGLRHRPGSTVIEIELLGSLGLGYGWTYPGLGPPAIEIDGVSHSAWWGVNDFIVSPGKHTVTVHTPITRATDGHLSTTVIELDRGETLRLRWDCRDVGFSEPGLWTTAPDWTPLSQTPLPAPLWTSPAHRAFLLMLLAATPLIGIAIVALALWASASP